MRNGNRGRYTLEFKQEAARLVESGPSRAAAARSLGVVEQTLGNWVGKLRVQRLMQKHGIQARGKRRFRVVTTDSRHQLPIAPNVLDRKFTVTAPNQAWVGDLTYIATEEGWLFLAVVIDPDLVRSEEHTSELQSRQYLVC